MKTQAEVLRKDNAKCLGSYYTDSLVADFLVKWAIRTRDDAVLDPSFGDGVFLRAASNRILELDGDPRSQVHGVELDEDAHQSACYDLRNKFHLDTQGLLWGDFFEIQPASVIADAVVGNPPFIRYQRFTGQARRIALRCAASQGVHLSELTSSWAPFLVHSISMVRVGGRLAMVVPYEIAYASYARPVLSFLAKSFGRVTFITFQRKLFPSLSENTLLVLAEEKGRGTSCFTWRDLSSATDLLDLPIETLDNGEGLSTVTHGALCRGEERLIQYLLPSKVQRLYADLKQHPSVQRLGDVAHVGIGYVTGANEYFHFSPEQARLWEVPPHLLKPAVCRGRALAGLDFTSADWHKGLASGDTAYLLHIEESDELPMPVRSYLDDGERAGVHGKFKCRTRVPWYGVPHVYVPDAFLTYMSGFTPRLAANAARAVAPNSLHIVRIKDGRPETAPLIAAVWHNSLTLLSCEIEGHALGGGLLKLEPGEARRVLLPALGSPAPAISSLAEEIDSLLRSGRAPGSTGYADELLLMRGLGLTEQDCRLLRNAVATLMARRRQSGGKVSHAA